MSMDLTPYQLIIYDADGTLITTLSGARFRQDAQDWQTLPGRREKCHLLKRQGKKQAVASNQGGVAFGYLKEHDIRRALIDMAEKLCLDAVYMCPEHPQGKVPGYSVDSPDRKPGPGMLQKAMYAFEVTPEHTLFVGDMDTDQQAAQNAGCHFAWARDFFEDPA